jgi:excisionase family DNA binding protein
MAAPKPRDGAEPMRLALSVDEAAYALGVSRAWLYRCALQTGQLASVHLGRRVVIPIAALHVYLEAHLTDPLDTLAATGGLSGAIATPAAVRPAIRAR